MAANLYHGTIVKPCRLWNVVGTHAKIHIVTEGLCILPMLRLECVAGCRREYWVRFAKAAQMVKGEVRCYLFDKFGRQFGDQQALLLSSCFVLVEIELRDS
jgi:hypothetical protein